MQDQKGQRQPDHAQMAVNTHPRPALVLAEPDFLFGFLIGVAFDDRPTMGEKGTFVQGHGVGSPEDVRRTCGSAVIRPVSVWTPATVTPPGLDYHRNGKPLPCARASGRSPPFRPHPGCALPGRRVSPQLPATAYTSPTELWNQAPAWGGVGGSVPTASAAGLGRRHGAAAGAVAATASVSAPHEVARILCRPHPRAARGCCHRRIPGQRTPKEHRSSPSSPPSPLRPSVWRPVPLGQRPPRQAPIHRTTFAETTLEPQPWTRAHTHPIQARSRNRHGELRYPHLIEECSNASAPPRPRGAVGQGAATVRARIRGQGPTAQPLRD